jgi:hypothetical protein
MRAIKPLEIFLFLLFITPFTSGCNRATAEKEQHSEKTDAMLIDQPWHYLTKEDKMTSGKIYLAYTVANEQLNFAFPYDGGSTVTLFLSNLRGNNEVYLTISRGQMLTRADEPRHYKVRFDEHPHQNYTFIGSTNGDAKLTFVQNAARFIRALKQSKQVVIELEFYREGMRTIEFNVASLNWNH